MGVNYKLIAVDVDGTLMNSRNELPAANRAALHRAHRAGLKVCLCTGRMLSETQAVIDALGLDSDVGVFAFGSIVSELPGGKTLCRATIPEPLAGRLVAHFSHMGYPVLVLYDVMQAGVDYRVISGERNAVACDRWLEVSPASYERLGAWCPGPPDPVRIGIVEEPARAAETMASLKQAFGDDQIKANSIFAPNYGFHVVECFAPQVNKWYGIMRVAESLGIRGSEIMAIGDDVNDLEMIEHAGLGVAMGNAVESVKAVADWRVSTHDEAGVAEAIDCVLSGRQPQRLCFGA